MVHHTGITFYFPNDLDLSGIGPDFVHYAVWVRVPFRFRTGVLFHATMPSCDRMANIWVHNRFPIPQGTELEEITKKSHQLGLRGYTHYWSEVLLTIASPVDDQNELAKVRGGTAAAPSKLFNALRTFNEFVCAYATATKQIFGGAPLRILTDAAMFECLRAELTLLYPPTYELAEPEINEIFEWRPEREVISMGQLTGAMDDLPIEDLAAIESLWEKTREEAFREIAFKAKIEMVERDPIVALVLACAALEGAHSAFLRRVTHKSLVNAPRSDRLMTNLLREQGIHTLIQLTPFLFMPEHLRPSTEVVTRCAKAIEMRNAIMHATTEKGEYKIRRFTFAELSDAYSAMLQMYDLLVSAIDSDAAMA